MSQRAERSRGFRIIVIALVHAALVTWSYFAAILLRFEFTFPPREMSILFRALPLLIACRLIFFARHRLFEGWWQYVGVRDVVDILKSTTAGSLAFVTLVAVTGAFPGFPRSLIVLEWLLTLQLLAGSRVTSRLLRSLVQRHLVRSRREVLIVGSGTLAESTLRTLLEAPSDRRPVGFLDDGSTPGLGRLRGLPRLGRYDDLPSVLRKASISEVFIALRPDQGDATRTVISTCRSAGVPFRILPSVREHLDQPRPWDLTTLEQLFETEELRVDEALARDLFYQKSVLICGAGGQVGGALAWEVAGAHPRQLLLLDRNESPLYYLELALLKDAPVVPLVPVIGDLLDVERLRQVFREHRPDIVIHAAGYTRPDLLAGNFEEIRHNNLIGAHNVLQACADYGASRCLILSCDEQQTDGLACIHRATEQLLRAPGTSNGLVRTAMRFPSVLGSPGCLATRSARCLASGTPLVVADPEASVRVTSLRAVTSLLIEALAIASDGDVLALQVGRPRRLPEIIRYLRQVWNLPETPIRRPASAPDHAHPIEPPETTVNPRIVRRKPAESLQCVRRLLEPLDEASPGVAGPLEVPRTR